MTEIANKTQTSPFIAPLDPTLHVVHCVQLKKCVLNPFFIFTFLFSKAFALLNTI